MTGVVTGLLGFADGGYWPTAWGWGAAALLWLAAVALLLRAETPLGTFDSALIGLLAASVAWVAASSAWSESKGDSVLEVERGILYLAGLAAALLVTRQSEHAGLIAGTWVAVTAVSAYALTTRLLPGSFERFDSVAGYRLFEPIGYWNGLGALCALGALLALGYATTATQLLLRMLAAASLPVMVTALYFTFSRGAWLALGLGLAAVLALDPQRLRRGTAGALLALPVALAVGFAARSEGLTQPGAQLADAVEAGRSVGAVVVVAAAIAAALAALLIPAAERLRVPTALRRLYAGALVGGAVAAVVAVVVAYGGPFDLATRARDAFTAPPRAVGVGESLNVRLFSLSGSGRVTQWEVALEQSRERPVVGTGAGTYELHWVAERPIAGKVRDAHSLYLETLAELGIVGLVVLGLALAVPLVAAVVARRQPLVPVAVGAYVVYLAHAGVDWDWEMPALTLAALFCGAAIVVAARGRTFRLAGAGRVAALAGTVALLAFALVGLLGNSALSSGWDALERGDTSEALNEASAAQRWAPWSAEPWRLEASAEQLRDRDAAALASLRTAVDKDPQDWNVWFDLAQLASGDEQRRALVEASRLNPLSPELNQFVEANDLTVSP